jgi:hypothetical protein
MISAQRLERVGITRPNAGPTRSALQDCFVFRDGLIERIQSNEQDGSQIVEEGVGRFLAQKLVRLSKRLLRVQAGKKHGGITKPRREELWRKRHTLCQKHLGAVNCRASAFRPARADSCPRLP